MDLFTAPAGVAQPDLFSGLNQGPSTAPAMPKETAARTMLFKTIVDANSGADVLTKMNENNELLQQNIELYGDADIRRETAANQQVGALKQYTQQMVDAPKIDPTGDLFLGSARLAQAAVAEDIKNREEYALEQETVNKIQQFAANGDETQARLLINNLEHGSADDVIRDINTKRLILQREIEKAQVAKDDQPWFMDLMDFALSTVPLNNSLANTGNVDLDGVVKGFGDWMFSGKRVESEAENLWNLSAADFSKYTREHLIPNMKNNTTFMGLSNKTQQLQILSNMNRAPSAIETNTFNALDNVGLLAAVVPLSKAISPLGLLVRNGARKEAVAILASDADNIVTKGASKVMSKSEVEEGLTVSAVNPQPKINEVPVAAEANDALDKLARGRAIFEEMMPDLVQPGRLTESELADVTKTLTDRMKTFTGRAIKDVKVNEHTLTDASVVRSVSFDIGKVDGGGFASKKQAENLRRDLGHLDAEVIRDHSGQWFVRSTHNMNETGFVSIPLKVKSNNYVSRRTLNARLLGDEVLADSAQLSGNNRNRIVKVLDDRYKKIFRDLDTNERSVVDAVVAKSKDESKWYGDDDLDMLFDRQLNRTPTPAEKAAYNAAKDINDVEYALRNDDLYKGLHVKGFETVTIPNIAERENALINRTLSSVPNDRIFDTSTGIHYTKTNRPNIEQMQNEGKMLVSLEQAKKLPDGTTIKFFFVKQDDVSIELLRRDQLAYRAGGHVMYKEKWFGKQAVRGAQKDNPNEKFLLNPDVHVVGTKAEVKFIVDRLEQARLAVKEGGATAGQLDEIFGGHKGLPTGEDFLKGVDEGSFQLDDPFEVVYDRQMPSAYADGATNYDVLPGDEAESGFNGWLRSSGRMYYGSRGKRLQNWMGKDAEILDAYQTINQSIMNIANLSSFSDYKMEAVERWVKTFGSSSSHPRGDAASNMTKFLESTPRSDLRSIPGGVQTINQMETQRDIIKRVLGWKTDLDREADQVARNISSWVMGDDPTSVRHAASKVVLDWWSEANPITALRSLAFDMKLGLWNPGQLLLQSGTMAAQISLSPALGMKGVASIYPVRMFLRKGATEASLNHMIDRGMHKMMGFEAAEFKDFLKSAKSSGFFDIGETHGLLNSYGPNAATSRTGDVIKDARAAGRFFFNEGELMNRIVAQRIAWGETKEALPNLAVTDPLFVRTLGGKAETYAMNMSRESQAWWQRGALSIPTQFWAYNARMMEAMLGNSFTPMQRVRLAVSQTVLYGTAGLPLAPFITDMMDKKDGKAADLLTARGFMDRGLVDNALYVASGGTVDALVSGRFGTGTFSTDLIKDIMGWSQFGEKPLYETAGGATTAIMGDTAKTIVDLYRYAAAEQGVESDTTATRDNVLRVASNVSTLGNLTKAYYVFKYGEYISNKGTVASSGLPTQMAFAAALGFQSGDQDDIGALMAHMKDKKETVEEHAKIINNLKTRWANEVDRRPEIEDQIALQMQLIDPEIRQQVRRKVYNNTDKSLYESLQKQKQKQDNLKLMIEEQEENGGTN